MSFPCTSCGACCRRINIAVSNSKQYALANRIPLSEFEFPYNWNKDGVCENLDENNMCRVYETRPNICNIEWLKNRLAAGDEFYTINADACNSLQIEDGIDESFRIILDETKRDL